MWVCGNLTYQMISRREQNERHFMQLQPGNERSVDDLSALTEVFEKAPAFMAVLAGAEHVFEMVNPAYYQLVGHRDIVGKSVLTAIPEVEGQGYIELLNAVLQTGDPFVGEEMSILLQPVPGGPLTERYLNFVYQARRNTRGEIVGVFAHGVDVTELVVARQKSEERAQQIKQQTQMFDSLLSHIMDFVYAFDRQGRFTYANRPLLDLLGITLEQIIGKTFFDLPYPEALAATLHNYILRVVESKQQIVDETPYTSPTGLSGYYEYIFSPVLDEDGQVAIVAGSTRDVTERVQQERQKDEFLGVVSHELKTPVTSIKAYIQVLQKRLTREGNTSVVVHLAKIDERINKLTALIGDLLDVTTINGGKLQFHEADFAFDDEVAEAIEEVQQTAERRRIVLEGATDQIIHGDKDRIGQAIVNLLTNAVKYSPQADTIQVTAATDGERVTLSVQDFGPGISADQLPHVFERFYRAPEKQNGAVPGLGLGLYIASEIIQRHGGTIGVESAIGQGATFSFSLPVVADHRTARPHVTPPEMDRAHD